MKHSGAGGHTYCTHLEVFHLWEASGNTSEAVVVQTQLSQPGKVAQTAVLYVSDVVEAKAQPRKNETKGENVNQSEIRALHGTLPELLNCLAEMILITAMK